MVQRILLATILLLILTVSLRPMQARVAQSDSLVMTLEPSSGQTVSGLVILSDAGDDRTNVQVQIVGAEPGTATMIHAGTCTSFNPTPVALLGDAGAAGTIQSTITVSFASVTDGNHIVAVHAAITSLDTTLACGEIPTVDGVDVAPTAAGGLSGGDDVSYISPTYRYRLTWSESWRVENEASADNIDTLVLVNSNGATIVLVGHIGYEGNPETCLDAWATNLEERLQGNELRGLDEHEGQVSNSNRAARAMRYQLISRLAMPTTTVHYHECRHLSAEAVLEIDHQSPESDYEIQAGARDDVLSSLVIDTDPAPVTVTAAPPAPTEDPAPTQEPAATVTPNPTVGPECAGVPEWYAATVARLTRLSELLTELGRAQQIGDPNKTYLIYLDLVGELESLVPAQRDADTPEGVRDLNDRLVAALERYSNAVTRYLEILQNAIGVTSSEAQAVIIEGTEAFTALGQVSREVVTFVQGCGVKTTG